MLKKIALALALLLGGAAAFVASRPSQFEISRSRTLVATPDVVHSYLSDFRTWPDWSPWEDLDPDLQRTLSEPPSGTGATYAWSGNEQVGKGRMTITDSQPGQSVSIRLDFMEPWSSTSAVRFELAPSSSGTSVTWSMRGENGFVAKAFALAMDVDAIVGSQFERGLASLDAATADAGPEPAAP